MKSTYIKMLTLVAAIIASTPAMAEEAVAAATANQDRGLVAIACGIAIAFAALGGTLGQGKAIAAALEGVARNPAAQGKILIPMILGLAFIESLVVLAWLIANRLG